ncbi:FKBP-type peptidyl-prolyl cis-trans isomerase FkpA [Buchnera aphidicola str. Bp (Baizongia pistaciae)]|uniref:FKBP-type peptidyl-prolyl cis-trans isomerase FkpA n=1 Tax=Buchnera aphidicola subsp. Baizongia pistaciae (strain Bp) TaxID=224915 RepID=FKBA_BUCBP|nr:FKBP-type peptidyl-prolyl cis-trans isomerase [Buchnera aphidicola]Q89A61.1 RecName: Full=FKBP-type peptidyl-prolyl cis-trans isomerase FkpA; Short=PPIase; AltName: Full=Rotamase [Buchnera aphidicola str. Bp (Baizongia pistaciae)]AAO27182.1 FKBP-type peptidyl-prolyl cis-trans isomerase FkpA [Buchnera aphidicola str. Bp (Baizongia pistaciae)]
MILLKIIHIIFVMIFLSIFFPKSLYASTSLIRKDHIIQKNLENFDDQSAYALGVSLGNYINHSFREQKRLGVILDKNSLLSGIRDSLSGKTILSDQEISMELIKLEKKLKYFEDIVLKKEAHNNKIQGDLYIKKMLKKKDARHTSSGLVFFIKKKGSGKFLHDSDVITVHYKGSLINGNEFDNSYKRGQPLSFSLDSVIPGWIEGLKYIKKGGLIKLVIPPKLAYGETGVPGIPGNSTLIFEIELIDIQSK